MMTLEREPVPSNFSNLWRSKKIPKLLSDHNYFCRNKSLLACNMLFGSTGVEKL